MSHYYDFKEWKYPSVTTIISDATDKSSALCQWSANQAVEWLRIKGSGGFGPGLYLVCDGDLEQARFAYKETSQTALDVGSEVHGLIESYFSFRMSNLLDGWKLPVGTSEQAISAFSAFWDFQDKYELTPIALEQTVYGDFWGGKMDYLGYFNDKLYVIDWKSSKAHYPEMRYQVAAYRSAVDSKKATQGCGILRLDKETGLPDWKDTTKSYEKDLRIFNRMTELYFERHPRIAKAAGWKG